MGYCDQIDIQNIIGQSLTSATQQTAGGLSNSTSDLLYVGNVFDNDIGDSAIIDSYIQIADRRIDATLSELYKTPFTERVDLETELFSDINEYNDYIVLEFVYPINPGDKIIIIQGDVKEEHIIREIISPTVFSTTTLIQYYFDAGARIVRVSYPDPIKYISARMAAANLYDKYFVAESSPNTSTFGDKLRQIAYGDIDDILSGITILHGSVRIGRRFYNSNLAAQYNLPSDKIISRNRLT